MPDAPRHRPPRQFSSVGAFALVAGIVLMLFEWNVGLVEERLGAGGKWTILTCGAFFAFWGLKEIVAGLFPTMRRSALGRHRFRLPVEGQIYLVIMFVLFIGSVMGRSNPLMLVFSLMAGPFVVNGWLTFTLLKKLSVRRSVPARIMAGEPVAIEITLRNDKRRLSAWLMSVFDRVANRSESLEPAVLFARIPPREEQSGQYTLRLMQRGVYAFGPIQIRTRYPLGLVERGLNLEVRDEILVYPRIGRLVVDWQERMLHAAQLMTTARPRGGLINDEFHKLRDYRRGDDVRAIHWKTSARRDELMVREFQISRDQHLAVLLDAWAPSQRREEQLEAAELAISLAATMCADQSRGASGSLPAFAVNGKDGFLWGGPVGSHRLEQLLDGLARLQVGPQANVVQLVEAARPLVSAQHRVVLVTPRADEADRELEQWVQKNPAERARYRSWIEIVNPAGERAAALVQW